MIHLTVRFYEELNDFLPLDKQKKAFAHVIAQDASVKDVIESLGVPHTEIDLILVNGTSVDFKYKVRNNDSISVYPVFESFDISPIIRLRPQPLRKPTFILDTHLGKLTKHLRLLGFDAVYDNHFSDHAIAEQSVKEHRIVLTRDVGLLKNKIITHGHWVRHTDPEKQVIEVLKRFDLYQQSHPFTRCIECNGQLQMVSKQEIIHQLLPDTITYYQSFARCDQCHRIYWEGTHYKKLKNKVNDFLNTMR